ncbi:hypothetical protein V2J09_015828 [Rumex salicifolius]
MGRAPCCWKTGLKKGPWTPQEDQILISYIQLHGHSNWRALPMLAGLLRCGKSCRLRWVNYLNPDIKRGNFTPQEEDAIFKLHELLGNRWSAIAARLPGRTDNEIKNIWHTHLKKKLNNNHQTKQKKPKKNKLMKPNSPNDEQNQKTMLIAANSLAQSTEQSPSTTTTTTTTEISSMDSFPEIDESFWSDDLTIDDFEMVSTIDIMNVDQSKEVELIDQEYVGGGGGEGEMDFWYDVFVRAGGLPELPDF